jgi:hypothetical protein
MGGDLVLDLAERVVQIASHHLGLVGVGHGLETDRAPRITLVDERQVIRRDRHREALARRALGPEALVLGEREATRELAHRRDGVPHLPGPVSAYTRARPCLRLGRLTAHERLCGDYVCHRGGP